MPRRHSQERSCIPALWRTTESMALQQALRKVIKRPRLAAFIFCMALALPVAASEHHGQVLFGGLPVPGATITATQGTKKLTTVSDEQGRYSFPDLPDGAWKIDVEITFFTPLHQDITVAPNTAGGPGLAWQMKMLPLDQVIAQTKIVRPEPSIQVAEAGPKADDGKTPGKQKAAEEMPRPKEESAQSSDGFLVNGSSNNAATSQFSLDSAFGNTRKGSKSLYTGGLGLQLDNSALDARPFSITGLDTPKSSYDRFTATATFGGPLKIPHVLPHGPNFFLVYQWVRNSTAATDFGLVPTDAQRSAANAADPLAQELLNYYPLPNAAGDVNYNYQVPILNEVHQDAMQLHLDKNIGKRDQFFGTYAFQSSRADNTNLFGFRDVTDTLGMNGNINWEHRLAHGLYANAGYKFSRLRTLTSPYYAQHGDTFSNPVIPGRSESSMDAGPPTLNFASGITSLTDAISAFNRFRTDALSGDVQYYRGHHNFTVGGDFRRQEYNYLSQLNPRGTYNFTGAATGSDFSDFLQGTPDTSAIDFGNADKYLRESVYDAYGTDDWRIKPELTINAGLRWEYGAPITESKNRLVNLDVTPNFANVAQVLASNPHGPLTGQQYPNSLLRPDRLKIEPRLGISWRPIPGSSVVVRAGYGIYADTSVYQATALQLAQQAPLSKSLSLSNSAACPLTLATGFRTDCTTTTANTFAVDPNFRVGYAQTWQISVQRDLPGALQMTVTYLGIKGLHGVQEFLPNTYPLGGSDPCSACQSGYLYRTSNGSSTREGGSVQVRRRLRSGLTATALYTYSKSIDNDAVLGGQGPVSSGLAAQSTPTETIAQNWLDLNAERSRSSFDQRHLLTSNIQYTTGTGLGGGTLLKGWRGRAYKEWTVVGTIVAGSGLPETPVYYATINGAGFTGTLRPDRTSVSVYGGVGGRYLNAAAYSAPQLGLYGNAGRNSMTGPAQFTFNSSLGRTFRLPKSLNLDIRVDSTNFLNHVVFTSYNNIINPSLVSPVFGLPVAANPMRSLQTTARLRF